MGSSDWTSPLGQPPCSSSSEEIIHGNKAKEPATKNGPEFHTPWNNVFHPHHYLWAYTSGGGLLYIGSKPFFAAEQQQKKKKKKKNEIGVCRDQFIPNLGFQGDVRVQKRVAGILLSGTAWEPTAWVSCLRASASCMPPWCGRVWGARSPSAQSWLSGLLFHVNEVKTVRQRRTHLVCSSIPDWPSLTQPWCLTTKKEWRAALMPWECLSFRFMRG